jgi:cytochrome c oxidase cbb3-type subunit III
LLRITRPFILNDFTMRKRMRNVKKLSVILGACLLLVPAVLKAQEPPPQQPAQQAGGQQRTQRPAARRPNFAAMAARIFTPGPAPDPAAVKRGQKLFGPTCGFCHGPDATGRSGPDLVASSLVIRDNGGNLIGQVVHNGRPGKGMPAFPSLSDRQIEDISAFLHSRVRAAANRFAYSFHEVVTGNAEAGKAYFDGAGKCSACHSVTGDLAGIANKFQPPELQVRLIYPGQSFPGFGGPPAKPTEVTVTLPSGETVSGTLISRNPFNIALRDQSGWYRSFPVAGAKIEVHDPLEAHKELVNTITDTEMHNLLAYLETLK